MEKVVLNIPHSGICVPRWAWKDMMVAECEFHSLVEFMTDRDVDVLWSFVPEENRQVASVSRLIVDVERFRKDEDEAMAGLGMGLYYTHAPDGKQFRRKAEDSYEECLRIYDEYHADLEAKVTKTLRRFGKCVLLDCHSFHDGMTYTGYATDSFPDVCIGVNGRISAEAQTVMDAFSNAGYSVKINEPFSGSLVPLRYYDDPRVISVMIELNRRIYCNENFAHIQRLCKRIYDCLT